MKYLFVDNFRGFSRTTLPIKDATFFVGENSTGKTSILYLLNVISSVAFWLYQVFDTPGIGLGNFADMVSIFSSDRSLFRFGLIEILADGTSKKTSCEGFLMTFIEKEAMPIVSRCTYLKDNRVVDFCFDPKSVKYQDKGTCKLEDDVSAISKIFLDWLDYHDGPTDSYMTYSGQLEYSRREVLSHLPMLFRKATETKIPKEDVAEIRYPTIFEHLVWLAPIRTQPRRTYDTYRVAFSEEGEHVPFLIRKILKSRKASEAFKSFAKKFGEASGLFDSVSVKDYGSSGTGPFALQVTLNRRAVNVVNVGYGVSQVLPIIVEYFARPKNTWFLIQQPEIHLHPKAQVALGDAFFELAILENKKFVIETHNDFIIDSYRLNYRRDDIGMKPQAQVVFFERTSKGNEAHLIEILPDGRMSDKQPPTYREFFLKEQRRLLDL